MGSSWLNSRAVLPRCRAPDNLFTGFKTGNELSNTKKEVRETAKTGGQAEGCGDGLPALEPCGEVRPSFLPRDNSVQHLLGHHTNGGVVHFCKRHSYLRRVHIPPQTLWARSRSCKLAFSSAGSLCSLFVSKIRLMRPMGPTTCHLSSTDHSCPEGHSSMALPWSAERLKSNSCCVFWCQLTGDSKLRIIQSCQE